MLPSKSKSKVVLGTVRISLAGQFTVAVVAGTVFQEDPHHVIAGKVMFDSSAITLRRGRGTKPSIVINGGNNI